ncbi:MAG: DUF2802 domain-containing protein [Betaproteobacteria bacterium]|nr:DUF2802 domain-containing protein [Betaproteobacteria bacterium]
MTVAVGDLLATTLLVLVVYLGILVFRLARLRSAAPRAAPAPVPAGPESAAAVPPAAATAPDQPPSAPAAPTRPAPATSATTPRPSTVHEEATALARQGLDAAAIARRCGISLGEAELVCWLANHKEPR